MKTEQKYWKENVGWSKVLKNKLKDKAHVVFAFGARRVIENPERLKELKAFYPKARILLCSTAGEIFDNNVFEDSLAVTAVHFGSTKTHFIEGNISEAAQSKVVGQKLATALPTDKLVHAMVFSDGLKVNGTALVNGLNEKLPSNVSVTGGLVGDGGDFKKTVVGLDKAPESGNVVLMGFYGDKLKVGYGSLGGWDAFGLERTITKSKDNVLYELDGQPALKLYKEYLGEQGKGLPSTGLLFPLRLRLKSGDKEVEVVRTILGINEADQSMTFAGDMPEGTPAMLMKANFDRLVDGALNAGSMSVEQLGGKPAELAILISCIGRKLVLKERVEDEIEAVRSTIGPAAAIIGFYSYGELCPVTSTEKQCQLHNQTMTITTFREEA
ncbi:MAG: FIST N-terminal domain-containing protein [Candidatus Taylorbacteria bacterium]|nr:FIST N-terminal domain-containing protein [Candidatus Taylorbacteria bacterium]